MFLVARKSRYESECAWNTDRKPLNYPQALKQFEESIFNRNFKSKDCIESYQIGYWRKANAIHKWFVDNCGDEEDTCQDMYIELSDATELLEACEHVLKDHSLAEEEPPTTEGFFFGSQEYDDWYFKNVQYTYDLMKQVKEFLENPENRGWSIIYHASW